MRASLTRTVRQLKAVGDSLTCREGKSSPLTFLILRIVEPRLEGEGNINSAEMAVERDLFDGCYREIAESKIE